MLPEPTDDACLPNTTSPRDRDVIYDRGRSPLFGAMSLDGQTCGCLRIDPFALVLEHAALRAKSSLSETQGALKDRKPDRRGLFQNPSRDPVAVLRGLPVFLGPERWR